MKKSLLKWLSHLYKGTTYGYATRKDCLVVFGFLLLSSVLPFLYYFFNVQSYKYTPKNIQFLLDVLLDVLVIFPFLPNIILLDKVLLDKNFVLTYTVPFLLTVIATFSLIVMRINDIYGKRYFTTKLRIFAFFLVYTLIERCGMFILNIVFDVPFRDCTGWLNILFWFILCVYPPSKKREEIPIVELPEKPIAVLVAVTFMIYSSFLHKAINDLISIPEEKPQTSSDIIDKDKVIKDAIASYIEKNKLIIDSIVAGYTETLRIKPDDIDALFNRGLAYSKNRDFDLAIADYNEALRIEPDNYKVLFERGFTYIEKGDFDLAIADYNDVLKIKPDDGDALLSRGYAYHNKGDFDRAVADYTEALKINPNDDYIKQKIEEAQKRKLEEK